MALGFGQVGHLVEEVDGGDEALDHPILADPEAVAGEPPAGEALQLPLGLLGRDFVDDPLAGKAFLGR